MILSWTSFISIFLFRYIFKDYKADMRYLLLGTLFPKILDLILNITDNYQFIGHSLFFSIILFFLIMISTNRNTIFRKNSLLACIGMFFYLFLSFTWLNQSIFLYPLFSDSNSNFILSRNVEIILSIIGVVYFLFKIKNLTNFKYFLKSGLFI
jgi:hypothetical protein